MIDPAPYSHCPYDGEKLVDKADDPAGHGVCARCGFIDHQNPKACVAILILQGANVLLVRRGVEPAKGEWEIPGGFVEAGESAEETVVREALEDGFATGGTVQGGAAGEGGETGGGGNTESPLVALVRGSDWATAVLDAIALVGGLPDLTGKTVLLKPNVVNSNPPPVTTNPEVIRGAIRAVRARGATTVLGAEAGAMPGRTRQSMQTLGIVQVCTDEAAEAVALDDTTTTPRRPPGSGEWPDGIPIFQTVLDADYVINLPCLKTHATVSVYTMAIKNWFGCIPQPLREHPNTLGQKLAELHLAKPEDFVIADAVMPMVTGGPDLGGDTADARIVIASRDVVAADVTGLCIEKQFGPRSGAVWNLGVWEHPQLRRAMELGFPGWLTSPQNFTYAQQGVDEHAEIMAWRDALRDTQHTFPGIAVIATGPRPHSPSAPA